MFIGDIDFFENLLLEGYDHIIDIKDNDGNTIIDVCNTRGHNNVANLLESVKEFEVYTLKLFFFYI